MTIYEVKDSFQNNWLQQELGLLKTYTRDIKESLKLGFMLALLEFIDSRKQTSHERLQKF